MPAYFIQRGVARVHLAGFPHSDILGSKPACGSPRLFAACHVLHRLLAPRHSPYALSSLIIKLTQSVFTFVQAKIASTTKTCRPDSRVSIFPALRSLATQAFPSWSPVSKCSAVRVE